MKLSRNVLCFMFEFPPLNFAGVYRQIRFANALVQNGNNVIVLTQSLNELKQNRIDNSLLHLVDPRVKIVRLEISIKKLGQNSLFSFYHSWRNECGDDFYNSINNRINLEIDSIIKESSIDIILCSAPPFSISKLASEKSQKFNIPLILDFRDAWLGWTMVPFPSYDYYIRRKYAERKVLDQATVIISVTNELIKRYQKDHPNIPKNKFKLVYNSPNKKLNITSIIKVEGLNSKSVIQIGYSGSFYYTLPTNLKSKLKKPHRFFQYQRKLDNWIYRSPLYFFKLLSSLFDSYPEYKQKVYFHYIGEVQDWLKSMVLNYKLENNVIFHGYLSYSDTKEKELGFDYLLSTSEKTKEQGHYCLPSKLFNYLEAGKAIFALINEGPQMDLIKKINCGVILNPDEISTSLLIFKKHLDEGIELKLNIGAFKKYSIESTNSDFLEIVDSI